MTDQGSSGNAPTTLSSSAVLSKSQGTASSVIRPRNRRLNALDQVQTAPVKTNTTGSSASLYLQESTAKDHTATSQSSGRPRVGSGQNNGAATSDLTQFLGDSWSHSWTSVQTFASAFLYSSGDRSKSNILPQARPRHSGNLPPNTWGPAPPTSVLPGRDIAAGSIAHREAALKAVKTASVLESHEGVNGGLDIVGRHKRRTSDEITPVTPQVEEELVFVHDVQPNDTYAGIILRYKCREDVFRRSNGLWSRDSVQTRKRLIIPVDACEIKGRPCNPPLWHQTCETDLLAPTPSAPNESLSCNGGSSNDFFSRPGTDARGDHCTLDVGGDDRLWTHVRWVQIDSFTKPVQIARIARQALGYFPPRRKKSVKTMSSMSTPRQSSDLASLTPNPIERPLPRRFSSLGGRPPVSSSSTLSRSRAGSEATDNLPTWMRRPGGVGSMSKSVREPGPDKDYFNSWTKKHLPGLNIEGLPSMSVMGSETAQFGFGQASAGIVESPFGEGRDAVSNSWHGSGLDRAAAVVEHWLRGALAKRPTTPLLGGRPKLMGMSSDQDVSDLIELTDAATEDGKLLGIPTTMSPGTTRGFDSNTTLRGRASLSSNKGGPHPKDD